MDACGWILFAFGMILTMLGSQFSQLLHIYDSTGLKSLMNEPRFPCSNALEQGYPFCNRSLPIKNRAEDLVKRLCFKEKINLLVNEAAGVPRLGIPPYQWWSEALHGVAESPGVQFAVPIKAATSFPQVILLAASFNSTLWKEIGKAVSTEGRAMYNYGLSGLTFWSPNINIFRDPRWGRGQETPGEDPLLTSIYSINYVKGLQNIDDEGTTELVPSNLVTKATIDQATRYNPGPKMLKVSACCKHFTAYDMEDSGGTDRRHFNALVTLQDLEDTYNPPFKACIQDGGVSCIMCSYNRVNGIPTCADPNFLTKTIRQKWGLDGYIVSDCDAVSIIYEYVKYAATPEDAVAEVLKAGLDLNCGTYISSHAQKAIEEGKLSEVDINEALLKLVLVQMRLGHFDGNPKTQLYGLLGPEAVCTTEHQHLAFHAARESIVLLKNEREILPLSKASTSALGVVGPHGNATNAMLGNYAGIPCKFITPLQGLEDYSRVFFQPGCSNVSCEEIASMDAVLDMVKIVDTVVLIFGLNLDQEKESHDRTSLLLPGKQQALVTAVAATAAAENHPVVLVIMCGGPVDISFAKDNANISSILWIGYPGEAGGKALAQVLYGDYNPGGRLPVTWYPEDFVKVSMLDMNMRPNKTTGYPGRTYRFYIGKTVYDFGHGKSFTTFLSSFVSAPGKIYANRSNGHSTSSESSLVHVGLVKHFIRVLDVEGASCRTLNFKVSINVTNTGKRDGSHVLLLYANPPENLQGSPKKYLIAFKRIYLQPKRSKIVEFNIVPCKDLALVQSEGEVVLYSASYRLSVDEAQHSVQLILNS